MTLLINCCGIPTSPEPVKCVFEHPVVMCCFIGAVTIIFLGGMFSWLYVQKNKLKSKEAEKARQHEKDLKDLAIDQEKYWAEEKKKEKLEALQLKIREYSELTKIVNDQNLDRKIREYNELTIHQKLLEKATGIDKDIDDLKKALEEMKKKYESLDGEIENIIIKKKQ